NTPNEPKNRSSRHHADSKIRRTNPRMTLVANSRWRSPDGSLGKLGALAKRFPPVHKGRAEFATSVKNRLSRHPADSKTRRTNPKIGKAGKILRAAFLKAEERPGKIDRTNPAHDPGFGRCAACQGPMHPHSAHARGTRRRDFAHDRDP